ncbi:MAG: hypothetical protein MKZ70_05655 [Opitutales bacterium]|nr:hypothetical protein [Opitutales bacterium]
MATVVDIGKAAYPKWHHGVAITPMQGVSLSPALEGKRLVRGKPIFWQWKEGAAIRDGNYKAVRWGEDWELYDISTDRNESRNLAAKEPERLVNMAKEWKNWYASAKLND